jgi:hypothetical protein
MPRSTAFRIRRQGVALLRGRGAVPAHAVDELTAVTTAALAELVQRRSA